MRPDSLVDELEDAIEEQIEKYKSAGGRPEGAMAVCASFLERMLEVQPKKLRDAIKTTFHQKICQMRDD